jgi:hypothetical protein
MREGSIVEGAAHARRPISIHAVLAGAAGTWRHSIVVGRGAKAIEGREICRAAVLESAGAVCEICRCCRLLLVWEVAVGTVLACDSNAVPL